MSSTKPDRLLSRRPWRTVVIACIVVGSSVGGSSASAAGHRAPGAFFSSVSPHYKRVRLPDGSVQPETYAFGNGGCTAGQARDESIDDLPFLALAAELVDPLTRSGYVACKDPGETSLLIMVHWGTTRGASDAELMGPESVTRGIVPGVDPARVGRSETSPRCTIAMSPGFDREQLAASGGSASLGFENRMRDQLIRRNAQILGFADELRRIDSVLTQPGLRDPRSDIVSELEESRYFVILVAYDFQKAWKAKTLEVLWSTRFSVRTRGNRFDERLPSLASEASRFFGADSHGLVRGGRQRVGTVTIGPAEVIGQE